MIIHADRLERIITRIFSAAGCSQAEAGCIARHLVDSNLCGHDSHGVIRVIRYVEFLRDGKVKAGQAISVVYENATAAVLDGNRGFGQVIGEQAMDLLAAKAKSSGMAMIALRNTGHLGRLGDWAEQLARHDLISFHFLNTTGLGMLAAGMLAGGLLPFYGVILVSFF